MPSHTEGASRIITQSGSAINTDTLKGMHRGSQPDISGTQPLMHQHIHTVKSAPTYACISGYWGYFHTRTQTIYMQTGRQAERQAKRHTYIPTEENERHTGSKKDMGTERHTMIHAEI